MRPQLSDISTYDSNINRNCYVCVSVDGSGWSNSRYIKVAVVRWNGSSWVDVKSFTKMSSSKIKKGTMNLGVMWRTLVGNRYRIKIKVDDDA